MLGWLQRAYVGLVSDAICGGCVWEFNDKAWCHVCNIFLILRGAKTKKIFKPLITIVLCNIK